MSGIENWYCDNNLVLNTSKTNIVFFNNIRSNIVCPNHIFHHDQTIQVSPQTRVLGIMIDKNLNWGPHCDALIKRLNIAIYSLKVLKYQIDTTTLKTLYYSNFQSLMSYGIIFWGGSSQAEGIFIVQKLALRTMFGMKFRSTCRGIFRSNNIMTLPGLYIFRVLLFFVKNNNYWDAYRNCNNTRRMFSYFFPAHKYSLTERSAMYMGIKLFSYLPREIKIIKDIKAFRKALSQFILKCEPYSMYEFKVFCDTYMIHT